MQTWRPIEFVRNAARNSPWVVMAVALHLIVFAAAAVFVTHDAQKPIDDGASIRYRPSKPVEVVEAPPPPEPVDRRTIPKPEDDTFVDVTAYEPDRPVEVDVPPDRPGEIDGRDDGTKGNEASTAIGPGTSGGPGKGVSPFPNRKGDGKGPIGTPSPRTVAIDEAVLHGLVWLARHQSADGSWGPLKLVDRCAADSPCFNVKETFTNQHDTGATGLALLAFLGAGYSHQSKQRIHDKETNKVYVIGDVLKNGLVWLTKIQNSEGSFGAGRQEMYNQALATMALSEAYGLSRARIFKDPAQRAVNYLAAAQRPAPTGVGLWGWRYAARQEIEDHRRETGDNDAYKKELYDSDTSVTGWAVMALKSARLSGLVVGEDHLQGALNYVKWATGSDGLVGYNDPKVAGAPVGGKNEHFKPHVATMSALGMCVRIFTAHDPSDPFHDAAAKRLVADLPTVSKDGLSLDYYYWYYGSLALNQLDGPESPRRTGKYWDKWNKAMVDAVLETQAKARGNCNHGGWIRADRWAYQVGPIYTTAINVLTLEVYYRYPNAFGTARHETAKPSGVRDDKEFEKK